MAIFNNEYRSRENTYAEPEKYLEILLSSVATEINYEIEAAKEGELQHKECADAVVQILKESL